MEIKPNDPTEASKTQTTERIVYLINRMVGNFTLFTEDAEEAMATYLVESIERNEHELKQQLKNLEGSSQGYIHYKDLKKIFKDLDIKLSDDEFEFLLMNLYDYTGTLTKLNYKKIYEIFLDGELKRRMSMRVEDLMQFNSGNNSHPHIEHEHDSEADESKKEGTDSESSSKHTAKHSNQSSRHSSRRNYRSSQHSSRNNSPHHESSQHESSVKQGEGDRKSSFSSALKAHEKPSIKIGININVIQDHHERFEEDNEDFDRLNPYD